MITGDPQAFGAAPVRSAAPTHAPSPPPGRSRMWMLIGAVAVVTLLVALVWPRSKDHPLAVVPTTAPSADLTVSVSTNDPPAPDTRPVVALEGRPAPAAAAPDGSTLVLRLTVLPSQVPIGTPVFVRLEGNLARVSPTIAALVWLDRSVDDGWETVAWIAQDAPGHQVAQDVGTGLDTGPSPDAITIPAGDAFGVDLDRFAPGSYRVCRYVPLASTPTDGTATNGTATYGNGTDVSAPIDNPVYLCTPITLT
jgi:hypothetical protein